MPEHPRAPLTHSHCLALWRCSLLFDTFTHNTKSFVVDGVAAAAAAGFHVGSV